LAERIVAGIDLGGTRFRVALFTLHGDLIVRRDWATEAWRGPESIIKRLVDAVNELAAGRGVVEGVGLGSPGPLDPWRGIVLSTENMHGWINIPLRDSLQAALGVPVCVDNDANLAALGEWTCGAGKDMSDLVYLTVSTGIGGGVVSGGRLLQGAHGLAAEWVTWSLTPRVHLAVVVTAAAWRPYLRGALSHELLNVA
jgi:glucokinase